MLAGRRFRVEFTVEQEQFAERIAGACRAVWNTGLEQRREYRRRQWAASLLAEMMADARADPWDRLAAV